MQIDITEFFANADPMDYSASRAELGDRAGEITWANAVRAIGEWNLLDTAMKRQAFCDWVRAEGAWSDAELAEMTAAELNALFLQFAAGDIRESGLQDGRTWEEYQADAESGRCSGNLWRDDGGRVYFSLER